MQLAENAFEQAISYGRSYPQPYASLCHVQQLYIENAIYRTGKDPTELYQQAKSDCNKSIEVDPSDSFAVNNMASNAYRLSEWMNRNGIVSSDILAEALMWNQKSMALNPDTVAYETKAIIHDIIALKKQESGQSPMTDIEIALNAYKKALELDPSRISATTANMLYAMVVKFQYKVAHGQSLTQDFSIIHDLIEKEKISI